MRLRCVSAWALIVLCAFTLCAAETQAPQKKLFLWQVKSGKATAYLLGSMHVAKADVYPLPDKIEQAFDASDKLVVEVNVAGIAPDVAAQMMAKATYPPDDSIDKHLSKELLDATATRLEKYGLPMDKMQHMKPWFIGMIMSLIELQRLGVAPQNGIDMHFLSRAAKDKKQIQELESADSQIKLLDSLNDKEQEQFLKFTEKDLENLAKDFEEMTTAWSNGDPKKVEAFVTKALREDPSLAPVQKRFFEDRNKAMAAKIEEMLKQEHTYFIVVGAGHLVGNDGLIQLLGKTHEVKQVSQ